MATTLGEKTSATPDLKQQTSAKVLKKGTESLRGVIETRIQTIDWAKVKEDITSRLDVTRPAHKARLVNPIATDMADNPKEYSAPEIKAARKICQDSVQFFILPEHLTLLQKYFTAKQQQLGLVSELYKTISFRDFLVRLGTKKFKTVYLRGHLIIPRDSVQKRGSGEKSQPTFAPILSDNALVGRQFLQNIGSKKDEKSRIFEQYLTLEECALSHLILPASVSMLIGNGVRSNPAKNPQAFFPKEFKDSVPYAALSYPAGAELRNGATLHPDLIFIMKDPAKKHKYFQETLAEYQKNPALMAAAREIYGAKLAFEDNDKSAFVALSHEWLLHKPSYKTRTKHTLKQILLAQNTLAAKYGLGPTFQLKGIGLGAFGFTNYDKVLEEIFKESLQEVLKEEHEKLTHITHVNLINLPTIWTKEKVNENTAFYLDKIGGITLTQSNMNPTSAADVAIVKEKWFGLSQEQMGKLPAIGGTVICGDSASLVGNEGNVGQVRQSSDDPAALYSMEDPSLFDELTLHPRFVLSKGSLQEIITFEEAPAVAQQKPDQPETAAELPGEPEKPLDSSEEPVAEPTVSLSSSMATIGFHSSATRVPTPLPEEERQSTLIVNPQPS